MIDIVVLVDNLSSEMDSVDMGMVFWWAEAMLMVRMEVQWLESHWGWYLLVGTHLIEVRM